MIFLASCATKLQTLTEYEDQLRQETFYSSYLALEYLQFSRSLLQNDNFGDSEHFAAKGIQASIGLDPDPESPTFWKVSEAQYEDLVVAQKRYHKIATIDLKNILPIQMAHLTFLYDCWVAKESKPAFRMNEMKKCKDRYFKLLDELEFFIENVGKKPPEAKIVQQSVKRYLLIFDFDKFKIMPEARRRIRKILYDLDDMDGNYRVFLVGNADSSGKKLYNERLSYKRANAVYNLFRKNGVPEELLSVIVQGEDYPDLITQDGVRQRFNRTVEVYIVKSNDQIEDIPLPILFNKAYKEEIEAMKKKKGLD